VSVNITDLNGIIVVLPIEILFNFVYQWNEPAILCEFQDVLSWLVWFGGRPPILSQLSTVLFLPSFMLNVLEEILYASKSVYTKRGPADSSVGARPSIPLK